MPKLLIAGALLLAVTAAPAWAGAPESAVRQFVEKELASAPGRYKVSVGDADARLPFAACQRLEPFVPAGTRLRGRTRIGLRCMQGASFTTLLQVQIERFGPALVAGRALAAGYALHPADLKVEEVELTLEPSTGLQAAAAAEGKILLRPLAAGQIVRAEYLRGAPAVAAGDAVKIVYSGSGFTVSTEGRALAGAAENQPVRVQTGSGRILMGTARTGRIIEVAF